MSFDENLASKRTRALGEVLDYLLAEFEHNHNPSPEQRRDISERTGMNEKAVRIWFQNRRAKLRKLERMGRAGSSGGAGSGGGAGGGGAAGTGHAAAGVAYDASPHRGGGGGGAAGALGPAGGAAAPGSHSGSMHSLRSSSFLHINHGPGAGGAAGGARYFTPPVEINENYCLVDCLLLLVGLWQRIKTGYHDEGALRLLLVNLAPLTLNSAMLHVDLLVILSKKNLELNYFFLAVANECKILFRIFYPLLLIITCLLLDNNINKENNELRVLLLHQPKFLVFFFGGANAELNQWSICDDFSEGQQVLLAFCSEGGTLIPHVLVGVRNLLQFLNAYIMHNVQQQQHIPAAVAAPLRQPPPGAAHRAYAMGYGDLEWDESRFNGFLPLGGLESETSPNSVTSNASNSSSMQRVGPLHPTSGGRMPGRRPPAAAASAVAGGEGAKPPFGVDTPDFLGGHTPDLGESDLKGAELTHSPAATYTHLTLQAALEYDEMASHNIGAEEQFIDLQGLGYNAEAGSPVASGASGSAEGAEEREGGSGILAAPNQTPHQEFDFTLGGEFLHTPGSEAAASQNHHVDSFIDYNSHYP